MDTPGYGQVGAVATFHNCTLYQSELGHMAAEVWFTHADLDVPRMHEVLASQQEIS